MTLLKSTSVTEVNGKKEVMMKKNALLSIVATLLVVAALTLVPSCAKSALPDAEDSSVQDALLEDETGPDDDSFEVTAEIELPEQEVPQAVSKISYAVSGSVLKARWEVGDTIFGYWMNGSTKNYISYKVSSLNASTGKARFTKLSGTNPGSGKTFYMFYAPRTSWYNQIMSSKSSTLTIDLRYQSYNASQFSSGTYSGKLPTIMTSVATSTANGVLFTFTHRTSVLGLVTPSLANSVSSEKVYQLILECTNLYTAGTFTPSGSSINFSDDSSTRGAIWLDCSNLTAGTCGSKTIFFVLFNGGTSGKMTMTARTTSARYYNVSKSYKSISSGNYYRMTSLSYNERWVIPSDCVDLGIRKAGQSTYHPPVYWRKANVGTTTIQDYGDYYQWGYPADANYALLYSSLPSARYSSGNDLTVTLRTDWRYSFYRFPFGWSQDDGGTGGQISSYNYNSAFTGDGGQIDQRSELDTYDDVAYRVYGTYYRTPNYATWLSLGEQTYCIWTSSYNNTGRRGLIIYEPKRVVDRQQWSQSSAAPSGLTYSTSKDRHIFLPAAGWITNNNVMNSQILNAYYWTSTLDTATSYQAYGVKVLSENPGATVVEPIVRYAGIPVRPIYVPTSKSN